MDGGLCRAWGRRQPWRSLRQPSQSIYRPDGDVAAGRRGLGGNAGKPPGTGRFPLPQARSPTRSIHQLPVKLPASLVVPNKLVTEQLACGSELKQEWELISPNRNFYAVLERDGNFVLYMQDRSKRRVWASLSNASGATVDKVAISASNGPFRLSMQMDNNLVVYDSRDRAVWSSGTVNQGTSGAFLVLNNKGCLQLLDGAGQTLWSSQEGADVVRKSFSQPVVYKQGVEKGRVAAGPPGGLSFLAPAQVGHGQSCLFLQAESIPDQLVSAAKVSVGHVEGAEVATCDTVVIDAGEMTSVFPIVTGRTGDVMQGTLLCWPAAVFQEKLQFTDSWLGYQKGQADPYNQSQDISFVIRDKVQVVQADGSSQRAEWYYQDCRVCHPKTRPLVVSSMDRRRHIAAAETSVDKTDISKPNKAKSAKKKAVVVSGAVGASGVHSSRFRLLQPGDLDKPVGMLAVEENELPFKLGSKAILYWMSRDQRVQDNWAMLLAQGLAKKHNATLVVVFNLVPTFLEATIRQFDFMLKGLAEVEQELRELHIPFHLLTGLPQNSIPAFVAAYQIGLVVCDMSPLRVPRLWVHETACSMHKNEGVETVLVDAHNVVPVWSASDKKEYAARTIRSKIHSQTPTLLTSFPSVEAQGVETVLPAAVDWVVAFASLEVDRTIKPVSWCKPGARAGHATLHSFIHTRMRIFADKNNDPTAEALSNLSPYLHFGQIAPQRTLLEVEANRNISEDGADAFIEQNLIRRELTDNYCWYEPNYDNLEAACDWAKESLDLHSTDKREYLYTRSELESGRTHDDLWNAAQTQVVQTGKMHGYLRMYWAKKILEWTASPSEALAISIYLNDRYQLDGRDPNGYVGCAWSIFGLHDQGWKERPVFGKIRYMNYVGCKRKFDVATFVKQYHN
eukprot:gb/GEZN01001245.1/.p1 GENE.gb/GEZN01001245.1/~~gb/GEZN01001245.1/.p1  ORF type:complete len:904 (-),score=106.31 gb/GEZN01001245.1/:424-3135(-)